MPPITVSPSRKSGSPPGTVAMPGAVRGARGVQQTRIELAGQIGHVEIAAAIGVLDAEQRARGLIGNAFGEIDAADGAHRARGERRALAAEERAGAGERERLFDDRVGGAGAAEDGEHAAGAVGHGDGEAFAIGGECGGIDERLHFGGGELDGVGGGIDGQRGGVALGDGDLDEAAAGAGR